MSKSNAINKGFKMEESLRNYFLEAGYYVVRGVPFIYDGFNVTDIDLWLYGRTSSVSREITIVDVKNKKTPQAIERIFWVQGLKKATYATNAVVATKDERSAIKNFGKKLDIVVLDGKFLTKLSNNYNSETDRLIEEEFVDMINKYTLGKLDGDWKGRMISCKSLLSKKLSFDSCNEWLSHANFFAEQTIAKPKQRETALRCLYIVCSYVAIGIDFVLKELSFYDQSQRVSFIKDGFTFGSKGRDGMKNILDVSSALFEQNSSEGKINSNHILKNIKNKFDSLNTSILGEFFSKTDISKTLFSVARELEYLAMKRKFSSHTNSSNELRSLIMCFLDFWGISRVEFSEKIKKNLHK